MNDLSVQRVNAIFFRELDILSQKFEEAPVKCFTHDNFYENGFCRICKNKNFHPLQEFINQLAQHKIFGAMIYRMHYDGMYFLERLPRNYEIFLTDLFALTPSMLIDILKFKDNPKYKPLIGYIDSVRMWNSML